MASVRPFIGWGNGALLFVTFAVVGVGFNVALDMVMRRFVTPEVRGHAGRTAAVTVQVLATIYAVLVAFVIVTEYNQLQSANNQVASKAADLTAMTENSSVFPRAEAERLRAAVNGYARAIIDHAFPELARTGEPERITDEKLRGVFRALQSIHPVTPDESAAYSQTLERLDGVAETKARIVNAAGETVPWPLVVLLAIMGIAVVTVSSVLDTGHRKSHLLITSALALLVALTLALVVSMNYPFDGILPISDTPIRHFLEFRAAR